MEQLLEPAKSKSRPRPEHNLAPLESDDAIWKALTSFVFLTTRQAALVLERDEETVQKRFNKFWKLHLLNREQQTMWHPYVYFRAPAGGRLCADRCFSKTPWAIREKSRSHIPHDLLISEFHLQLELALRKLGKGLYWEQWRDDMKDMHPVIPDARLAVEGEEDYTPLENRNARPKGGYKTPIEKIQAYEELGIKRVLWIFPTEETRSNFLEAIKDQFPNTHHWFTTAKLAVSDPLGKIWLTPKNYTERSYSILPPAS